VISVPLVGDRVEGVEKEGAHAAVGSSAARSYGGGDGGHMTRIEDPVDIHQMGPEGGAGDSGRSGES
jgi:hypothetical protein